MFPLVTCKQGATVMIKFSQRLVKTWSRVFGDTRHFQAVTEHSLAAKKTGKRLVGSFSLEPI